MANERSSTSKERAAIFLKTSFDALHAAGGSFPLREIKQEVKRRVTLTPYDLETYEKTGYVRWESVLHFYSIDCVKAGFIRKQGGLWHLTPEGDEARKLSGKALLDQATLAYRKWKANGGTKASSSAAEAPATAEEIVDKVEPSFVFERAEGDARSEIEQHVKNLGPYEFQDLIAALLRAMSYTTPFVAPTGPDGGTDILAYPDPLGAKNPRVKRLLPFGV